MAWKTKAGANPWVLPVFASVAMLGYGAWSFHSWSKDRDDAERLKEEAAGSLAESKRSEFRAALSAGKLTTMGDVLRLAGKPSFCGCHFGPCSCSWTLGSDPHTFHVEAFWGSGSDPNAPRRGFSGPKYVDAPAAATPIRIGF